MATNSSDEKRRMPTKCQEWMRRKVTNALSLLVAWFLVAFFTTDFGRGWCLAKNQGFQVSESRQNHVRLNVSNWMMMGALNGRS
jgi:uncharacterized protein (DUF2164 family)